MKYFSTDATLPWKNRGFCQPTSQRLERRHVAETTSGDERDETNAVARASEM
jgi:hypothetical protein